MSDKKPIDPEGIYTISAAARLLSVSPSTLRDLERRGKIECTWTPGRQRRFGGADLLRFRAASQGATPREPAPTPPAGASDTGDAAARRAWLGHLVARLQRELPVDTPAAIRLRVGTDLEHALGKWGPSSPLSDLEPLITSVVERAKHQVRTAQEESERREKKGELLDFGLRYLRRKLDGLSTRMVGARGSLTGDTSRRPCAINSGTSFTSSSEGTKIGTRSADSPRTSSRPGSSRIRPPRESQPR